MTDMVLQSLDNGLLTITMNRPERRNALNPDMTRGLVEAARRAAVHHQMREGMIKSAGGALCAGGGRSRGARSADQGRRRRLLRGRRRQVDGRGTRAAAVRDEEGKSQARHG